MKNEADIDEFPCHLQIAYVDRLAKTKAQHQWRSGFIHLGADTIVVLDEDLLGKPRSEKHAIEMLMRLSGRSHEVATGVAVFDGEKMLSTVVVTIVTFRDVQIQEAEPTAQLANPRIKLEPMLCRVLAAFS